MTTEFDYHNGSPLFPEEPEEGHLRDLLQVLWSRKKVVTLVFVLLVAAVAAVTLMMKPVFEATAMLEIRKTAGSASMGLEELFSEDLVPGGNKEVNTEVEILKSWPVAEAAARIGGHQLVLDTSGRLYRIFFERVKNRFKALSGREETKQGLPVQKGHEPLRIEIHNMQPLEESVTFKADFSEDSSFCLLDEDNEAFARGIVGKQCTTPLFSFTVHGGANPEAGVFPLSLRSLAEAAKDVQSNLEVTPVRDTHLIRLKVTAPSPDKAQKLLASVIHSYQQRKIEQKTQIASRALEFVNQQLFSVDAQMGQAVDKLKQFKQERQLVSLSDSVRVAIDEVTELEKQKQKLFLLRKQSSFLLAALEEKDSVDKESLYALGNAMDQPVLVSLATELSQLQAERAALRSQYTELYPAIQALDQKISKIKEKIKSEVGSLVDSIDSQQSVLDQEIRAAEMQLEKLPEAERQLADLTRQAKVYQDAYSFMLDKKGELQVTKASQLGGIWVAEPAHAGNGFIKPNLKRNLLLAIIAGLVLGVGLAFLLEELDDSVKTTDDIQSLVHLPVLGTIGHQPLNKKDGRAADLIPLVSGSLVESQFAESFRTLRTNLIFSSVDHPRRMIVFTSALPSDGKSTCSANLAVMLSRTGKKVLLVDADLRKPAQHRIFRRRRSPGLSNVLIEEDWQNAAARAIQPITSKNLYLLVAGERPPNPNEMLGSDKMAQLIEFLSNRFEFVLFDSPPLLTVSDSVVLARRLDGAVLVARGGKTTRPALKNTVDLLSKDGVTTMGVVLNDLDSRRQRYYYGYQYNAYYGEKKNKPGKDSRHRKPSREKKSPDSQQPAADPGPKPIKSALNKLLI